MTIQPRPPSRSAPPRRRATAGDTLFAFGLAALGLALAGAILAAGGGVPGLARLLPGLAAAPSPSTPALTPSPDRATPVPASPAPAATPAPGDTPSPAASPAPTATPVPTPAGPFSMNLYAKGVFVHQVNKKTCVAAAAQNMLNVIRLVEQGRAPDLSPTTQLALNERIVELTTKKDSHNGGTGPGGWAALLAEEGYPYEVRVYETRNSAMRAAATALRETGRPVGLLAWAGVHSWVLTGFKASADPATTSTFTVTTARVLDPWYPWISDRWPRSEAPERSARRRRPEGEHPPLGACLGALCRPRRPVPARGAAHRLTGGPRRRHAPHEKRGGVPTSSDATNGGRYWARTSDLTDVNRAL